MITSISVVVPVYNSAAMLTELVQRIQAMAESSSYQSEIVLVNDGSSDDSWDVICAAGARYPNVRGIALMRNYGQHSALLCGIRAARHDIVVTIDDDLQHPPEVIPSLLKKISEGYDVVYGKPAEEQHGFWRVMASRLTKFALQTAMGAETARNVSAFRAFRTQIREAFANYGGTFVSIDVLLTWGTTRFTAVEVPHHARQSGKSHYTFRQLARHALNMMTGFSVWPLQVASVIGFGCTLFGIAVLIYVVGRYLIHGGSVPGFPFLASIISIFSGAQLFALGIIGEYLARMHFRTMERPAYVVRSTTSTEPHQVQI